MSKVESEKGPESVSQREVVSELRAAVEARRELGGDLEEHLIESFLTRVEQQIDARVDRRLAHPAGPFALQSAHEYFGGWPAVHADPGVVALAFPIEGWRSAAALTPGGKAVTNTTRRRSCG